MTQSEPLASRFAEELKRANLTLEAVAERTKISKTTLRALLGMVDADVNLILPARVYMRGHFRQVAKLLGWEESAALALFDRTYPEEPATLEKRDAPRFPGLAIAAAAGLGGIAILAVVIAFAT